MKSFASFVPTTCSLLNKKTDLSSAHKSHHHRFNEIPILTSPCHSFCNNDDAIYYRFCCCLFVFFVLSLSLAFVSLALPCRCRRQQLIISTLRLSHPCCKEGTRELCKMHYSVFVAIYRVLASESQPPPGYKKEIFDIFSRFAYNLGHLSFQTKILKKKKHRIKMFEMSFS
jgi:hypothetical protein